MKLLDEFKAFALKGNVVDMAVGIIIGGAFGKIVSSLVSDIIMPPIGMLPLGRLEQDSVCSLFISIFIVRVVYGLFSAFLLSTRMRAG